jgi:CcmD family protein
MDNLGYLFAAYTIIFVVIFAYVLFVWRRQAALEAEIREVEERMRALDRTADAAANQQQSRTGS